MDLGIQPVISSALIMQLLAGAKFIEVNMSSKNDRDLFQATQKLLSIILTILIALAYLLCGIYGPFNSFGLI